MKYDPKHPEDFPPGVIAQAKKYTEKKNREALTGFIPRHLEFEAGIVSNVMAADVRDASTYGVKIAWSGQIPLAQLLDQLPTDALYRVKELADKILAKRPDARR